MSGMSATIGCVDGSWSWRYAHVFQPLENVAHAPVNRVASSSERNDMNVAKLSFSHRSSHHRIVTRSPNHMCAIPWRIVSARRSRSASVTLDRNTYASAIVTQPAFSMAPALNSGTKSWSYLPNG